MIIKKLKKYKQKMKQISLLELKINRLKNDGKNNEKVVQLEEIITQLKLDLQEMDIALECLREDETYLIKEHFIMGREWLDIEVTYNKRFRQKTEQLAGYLCKKANRALKTLEEFYAPIEELV